MEKSKMQSLVKRTVSALVMVPVVIASLWYGFPYINILALVIGACLAWEWSSMVPSSRPVFFAVTYTVVAVASVLLPPFDVFGMILLGALVLAFVKSCGEPKRKLLILGVPYIAIGVGSIVWFYSMVGFEGTMWFFLVVWGVDVGGFLVGSTVKGPKLAPKISPNKTWSGLLGGMLLSALLSAAFVSFYGAQEHILKYSLLAAGVAVISQIGDLIESAIKRNLGIKDSSNLIPGHGGMFDRVDGLIFAAPFMVVLCLYGFWLY